MIGFDTVRAETHADRLQMTASVAGAVVGALAGVAASAACGLPYLVAAGAIGTMACSTLAAAVAQFAQAPVRAPKLGNRTS